jgi:glycosyltransferase involved in cell wall biosynthesis
MSSHTGRNGRYRSVRILMLLENNPYPQDVRVRREAEALTRAGYQVEVVAPRSGGQSRHARVGDVEVRRFSLPRLQPTRTAFIVEYLLANLHLQVRALLALVRGVSVLHLHNPPDTLFPIAMIARTLRRKVVFDHHDLAPELFEVKFGASRWKRILETLERATFRCSDAVLSSNESHRDIALSRGRVEPSKVAIVRNAPPRALVVQRCAVRPGALRDPRLTFLGSMERQDGVDLLPDLVSTLTTVHGLNPHLTVIGDGSRRRVVERKVRRLGLEARFTFKGYVHHGEVAAQLAESDICLDPASCSDLNHRSTMVKVAEYMAAGKPIVAFGLRETIRTAGAGAAYARCGDLHDFAGKVADLSAAPLRRNQLAEAGRRRVLGMTWEHSESALLRAYAQLLRRELPALPALGDHDRGESTATQPGHL